MRVRSNVLPPGLERVIRERLADHWADDVESLIEAVEEAWIDIEVEAADRAVADRWAVTPEGRQALAAGGCASIPTTDEPAGPCSVCGGRGVLFRGDGSNSDYYICEHWERPGNPSKSEIQAKITQYREAVMPSGRWA